MKKTFFVLVIILCAAFSGGVYASEFDGYIVKVKEPAVSLMKMWQKDGNHVDDLYLVEDIDEAYKKFSAENIEAIFPNYLMELFDVDYPDATSDGYFSNQWYLNTINDVAARKKGLTGEGVRIAIIDSGVNVNHTDLKKENIIDGYNCIPGAEDKKDYADKFGHGTMVTGIIGAQSDNETGISGIAGNVKIIPIKVTDTNTFGSYNLIQGLDKALELDIDVLNLSLGGAFTDKETIAEIKERIDSLAAKGVIMIAAAGNSGNKGNDLNYPAAFDNVIGVGAVDKNLAVPDFSQKNEGVFLTAPGVGIITLSKSGGVALVDGTSLSTPIVSAAVCLIKEVYPQCTLQEIKSMLSETAIHPAGTSGMLKYDYNYGYGVLNMSGIVEKLTNRLPEYVITRGSKGGKTRVHIHNNSLENADLIYAAYDNKGISTLDKYKLPLGVANLYKSDVYDKVFLWKGLTPIVSTSELN